jgi:hypothetical protein
MNDREKIEYKINREFDQKWYRKKIAIEQRYRRKLETKQRKSDEQMEREINAAKNKMDDLRKKTIRYELDKAVGKDTKKPVIQKTVSYWKKQLDTVRSRIVRLRWARIDQDTWVVMNRCSTCWEIAERKYFDCGHYKTRGILALRYEKYNTTCQCKGCNKKECIDTRTYKPIHREAVRRLYWDDALAWVEQNAHKSVDWSMSDYEDKYRLLSQKLKEIKKVYNL